jgi:pimeloyl-ACP methyl ester carboxylesterase
MRISFASGCEERTAADGTSLRYYDIGSGDVPVVMLHGLFGSPSNWLPIAQQLEPHYRFLALQLPIDAASPRRPGRFKSIDQLTDHVACFFDELELDRAVVVGNSLGGQVGLDYYLRCSERVERLVLAGSAGLFERSLSGGHRLRLCRNFIREQASQIFYDPAIVCNELVDDIFEMLSDRGHRKLILQVAKSTRDRYMLDDLAKVDVPTLIVWGRDDTITPPFVAEQFCEHIRGARRVFLDECGHAPPIEQPAAFARVLHDFLGDLATSEFVAPSQPR